MRGIHGIELNEMCFWWGNATEILINYIYVYMNIASLHGCISTQQAIVTRKPLPPQRKESFETYPSKTTLRKYSFEWWKLCPFLRVHIALASLVRFVSSIRQFCLVWRSVWNRWFIFFRGQRCFQFQRSWPGVLSQEDSAWLTSLWLLKNSCESPKFRSDLNFCCLEKLAEVRKVVGV